jgi:hypothetical protein
MNTPGFTAEASLFKGDMSYQATAEATIYGGVVLPALSQGKIDEPARYFCLKPPPCFYDAFGRRHCLPPSWASWGYWNPITQSCE